MAIERDGSFVIVGQTEPEGGSEPEALFTFVSPDLFGALGMRLEAGRAFAPSDDADGRPVAIISRALADRYWPGENPIGQHIDSPDEGESTGEDTRTEDDDGGPAEIVGIVASLRNGFDGPPRQEVFLPMYRYGFGSFTVVVRTAGPSGPLVDRVKAELWRMNLNQTISGATTVAELVAESLATRRFSLLLLLMFAAVSLTLSAVGVYGLASFSTQQRRGEIGMRKALGAETMDILRLVVLSSLRVAAAGAAIGLIVAVGLTRLMRGMLFEIEPADPLTLAAVAAVLLVLVGVATALPARREALIDPMAVLRSE
jgi:putative ABC transport system permease protein